MSGTLGLSTPWARALFPEQAARDAVKARIPDGYAISVGAGRHRRDWSVRMVELDADMTRNRVVHEMHHRIDPYRAIEDAIKWIEDRTGWTTVTVDDTGYVRDIEDAS